MNFIFLSGYFVLIEEDHVILTIKNNNKIMHFNVVMCLKNLFLYFIWESRMVDGNEVESNFQVKRVMCFELSENKW